MLVSDVLSKRGSFFVLDVILVIKLQDAAVLTLLTLFVFILCFQVAKRGPCVCVRLCGRAPRVSACARALCGACRYCSSTEWFVSYNGGAGRTVLRQQRQDRRALETRWKDREERWSRLKQQRQQQQDYVCLRVSWTWPCDRLAAWL